MRNRTISGIILGGLILMILPLSVDGATLYGTENLSLPSGQTVEGNVYSGSRIADISSNIKGDVVGGAEEATLDGDVSDDVLWVGGIINLRGKIDGDARLAGGSINISNQIGGDLLAAGNSVTIAKETIINQDGILAGNLVVINGTVNGNVSVIAQQLEINGTVNGNIQATVQGNIILGKDATVGGNLDYHAPQSAKLNDTKNVHGEVKYSAINPGKFLSSISRGIFELFGFSVLFGTLAAGLLLSWFVAGKVDLVLKSAESSFWRSIGRGLLLMIMIPIVLLFLALSIIGLIVAAGGFLMFMMIILASHVLAGMFLGAWLEKVFRKQPQLSVNWTNALGGIIIIAIVGVVPVVGWLIKTGLFLAILGALTQLVYDWARNFFSKWKPNEEKVSEQPK